MKLRMIAAVLVASVAAAVAGCETTPNPGDASEKTLLHSQVQAAIADFKRQDPTIDRFFSGAEAYVVFPDVVTGALVIGGANGRGEVYQKGHFIGYATLTQASVGAQIGGQKYAEVIFFQNEGSMVDFKAGTTEFDARATAIAASHGAASAADYRRGVLVFTLPQSGLMAQAAIGGQKFRYQAATP